MDLHFEGNRLYYLEKEAELYKCLTYLSQELGNQEPMSSRATMGDIPYLF